MAEQIEERARAGIGLFGALLLLCGCATVPYRADTSRAVRKASVKRASCEVAGGKQVVDLHVGDDAKFELLAPAVALTARAEAPFPLSGEAHQGSAVMLFEDGYRRKEFTGTATWRRKGDEVCVTFRGAWSQHHLGESASVGPDGKLELVSSHPVELGPWCTSECEESD